MVIIINNETLIFLHLRVFWGVCHEENNGKVILTFPAFIISRNDLEIPKNHWISLNSALKRASSSFRDMEIGN